MLYHKVDDLVPSGNGPRHLQLYIYDGDQTLSHRIQRSPDLNVDLIRTILSILEHNPYVHTFKTIGSFSNLDEYKIELNTNITLDQRRYNAPTTSEVAAIWVEGNDSTKVFDRSVVVHAKGGGRPLYIRADYGCYDPLAYPLFFLGGETGWNRKMPYFEETDHTLEHLVDNSDLPRQIHLVHLYQMKTKPLIYPSDMKIMLLILHDRMTRPLIYLMKTILLTLFYQQMTWTATKMRIPAMQRSTRNLLVQGSTTATSCKFVRSFLISFCSGGAFSNNGLWTCTKRLRL